MGEIFKAGPNQANQIPATEYDVRGKICIVLGYDRLSAFLKRDRDPRREKRGHHHIVFFFCLQLDVCILPITGRQLELYDSSVCVCAKDVVTKVY